MTSGKNFIKNFHLETDWKAKFYTRFTSKVLTTILCFLFLFPSAPKFCHFWIGSILSTATRTSLSNKCLSINHYEEHVYITQESMLNPFFDFFNDDVSVKFCFFDPIDYATKTQV